MHDGGGSWHVLNEVVVDRGPSSALTQLNVLCDGTPVTTVQVGSGRVQKTEAPRH